MEAHTQQSLQTVMCQQHLVQFRFRSSKLHPTISLGDLVYMQLFLPLMLWAVQMHHQEATEL